jgi:GntR family transcriptional regulator of arabinose operon
MQDEPMTRRPLDKDNPLPLYYQLRLAILDRIAGGEFKPDKAIPSERKLAESYGVSRITVVKALNDLAQEGVLERRQGKGTFVSAFPRRIQIRPSVRHAVGFMAPVLTDPYLFEVVRGVENVATRSGYHLVVICTDEDATQEARYVLTARQQGLTGLIVYPMYGQPNREAFEQALADGSPLVFVDRYYPGLRADCVVSDDENGGYALTRHLLDHGHRQIAFVPWYEFDCTSVQGRLRGYRRALHETGLPADDSLIWSDLYPRRILPGANQDRLRGLLAQGGVTAVLAVNFVIATSLLRDLWACGLGIPEDISLVGFGLDQSSLSSPFPFTAAKQSGFEVGRSGARLLLERIKGGIDAEPQRVVVPVPLVINSSSGPAPAPPSTIETQERR